MEEGGGTDVKSQEEGEREAIRAQQIQDAAVLPDGQARRLWRGQVAAGEGKREVEDLLICRREDF